MLDKVSLLADGWREIQDRSTPTDNTFSKRFHGYPVCKTNGSLSAILRYWYHHVEVSHFAEEFVYDSFELEIRAHTTHDDWVILKSYSFDNQDEISAKCDRLLKAWAAAND